MVKANLAPSKAEAKRLIKQGGISIVSESKGTTKVEDFNLSFVKEDFENNEIVIKKGKKIYHKFVISQ